MIVLAIETATPQVGVALVGEDGLLAALELHEGRRHGEVLAPAIHTLMGMAAIGVGDIGLVAVDVGPGLFTGLRVGIATAKAMASALGVAAVGVTSTEILAAAHLDGAPGGAGRTVAAAVDIRRGEVAWAAYRGSMGAPEEVVAPRRDSPAGLANGLAALGPGVLVVGDGAYRYGEEVVAAPGGGIALGGPLSAHPAAAVLGVLAARRRDEGAEPAKLEARYLRDADVRIGWDQVPARG